MPHAIELDGKKMDVCDPRFQLVRSWLGRSNITEQGDYGRPASNRGPGWVEVCPHHVPCAGPCPDAHYARA